MSTSFWTSPQEWTQLDCIECGGAGAPCCEPPDVGYNKLIIFAGNYQEACDWAYQHGFRRRDMFLFPHDQYSLRGRHNAQAVIVGTFWERVRPDIIDEMLATAKYLGYKWVDNDDHQRVDVRESGW